MRRPSQQSAWALQQQVDDFNARYPVGTSVAVRRDNREALLTVTRSEAWVMSGHSAMIMVDGISGGYMLDRLSPVAGTAS